jgi:hypothetical protein
VDGVYGSGAGGGERGKLRLVVIREGLAADNVRVRIDVMWRLRFTSVRNDGDRDVIVDLEVDRSISHLRMEVRILIKGRPQIRVEEPNSRIWSRTEGKVCLRVRPAKERHEFFRIWFQTRPLLCFRVALRDHSSVLLYYACPR